MRKTIIAFGLVVVIVGSIWLARATSYTFLGSLVPVNNTTSNSASLLIGTFNMPAGTFLIQNGGLTATNALRVNVQLSVDNTNWLTVSTYWPSATNATTETYIPSYAAQSIYIRAQAVTTNSVNVGGTYLY